MQFHGIACKESAFVFPFQSLQTSVDGDSVVYYGRHLELTLLSTWGDSHYVGLTGIEVIGKFDEAIPITVDAISAQPVQSVASLPGRFVEEFCRYLHC